MVVCVIMIPVLYFAGAGSTVFWIIGMVLLWHIYNIQCIAALSLVHIDYEWVISIAECSPFSLFIECGFELTSNAKLIPIFFRLGQK